MVIGQRVAAQITKPIAESAMFTAGPASETQSACWRGLRSREMLTGTGLA